MTDTELAQKREATKKKRQETMAKAREARKNKKVVEGSEELKEVENELVNLLEMEEKVKASKKQMTTPWKQVRRLDIPESYKNPNFVYRWCNKDSKGNIMAKLEQGWEIDKDLTLKLSGAVLQRGLQDGTSLDSTMPVRELIVMRLPKERKAARDEFQKSRIKTSKQMQAQFETEGQQIAGGYGKVTYGKIQEE